MADMTTVQEAVLSRYISLEVPGKAVLEYIWISSKGELKGKTRITDLDTLPKEAALLTPWIADGTSSGLSSAGDKEIVLQPVYWVDDPFRGKPHKLCLCEAFDLDGTPLEANKRRKCILLMQKTAAGGGGKGLSAEDAGKASRELRQAAGASSGGAASGSSSSSQPPSAQTAVQAAQGAQQTQQALLQLQPPPLAPAAKLVQEEEPLFGFEQESLLMDYSTGRPYHWPPHGEPLQHSVYCGVGPQVIGRNVLEAHMKACLAAGMKAYGGINLECTPGCIEYQVGPSLGVNAADELWMARYILERLCEDMGIAVSNSPKPVQGFAGSGCHCNFSTKAMREEGGYAAILSAIEKLGKRHEEHLAVYGEGNESRLTGKDDTSSMKVFSWGVADRAASVRVPRHVERAGKGYLEDRRPAANLDPYEAVHAIIKTVLVDEL